jgi:Rod binding domain-containing protein
MTPGIGSDVAARSRAASVGDDDLLALAAATPEVAAEKFEGLFASVLLSEMKKTLPSGSFFGGGPGADVYDGMLERLFGERIAEQGGFGLARFIKEEAARRAAPAVSSAPTAPSSAAPSSVAP